MKRNKHDHAWKIVCGRLTLAMIAGGMTTPALAASKGGTNGAKKTAAMKRDPFWPVGYVPKNGQSAVIVSSSSKSSGGSWDEAMKRVVINGVSSRADNDYFAVINGEVKSVGETVSVRLGTSVFTWMVDGIEPPDSVKLRRVSVR